tara:strand:+ start:3472 stop:4446 length:975 start_codon:yes stop_codon:yes gene_type:complete
MPMAENAAIKDMHKGAIILALLLLVSYAASFGASYVWFCDILRHFIFQYFIGALILGVFFTVRKSKLWGSLMVLVALSTAYETASITHRPKPVQAQTSGKTLKIAHYNKWMMQPNQETIVDWIKHEAPDILVIQEPDPKMLEQIKTLVDYPYLVEIVPQNPFGFILISKYPITEHTIQKTPQYVFNNIYGHVVIDIPDQAPISLYTAHPVPPGNASLSQQRNSDLATLSTIIKNDPHSNIIFMGDFNITPYSPFFKQLLRQTGLHNEYTTLLPPPTWSARYYDYIFQIPIDHILHKGDLQLIDKQRGPSMGSDHHSLIAIFILE